jgi:hypothetical protein
MLTQWWRMMDGAAQIWLVAPQVIALRSARVLSDGFAPRAGTRREVARMVNEKTAAAGESATAMAFQLWRTSWELALMPARLWSGAWSGTGWWTPFAPAGGLVAMATAPQRVAAAASRIVPSGLAPVRRRVTANAKRLRRRKAR